MNKKSQAKIVSSLVILLLFILTFSLMFVFAGSLEVGEGKEIFDYDANTKTITYKNITIVAPSDIKCTWTDPNADWKLCEVVIAVTNYDTTHDFIEKNSPMSKFKHTITDMEVYVYTSPLYNTFQESILNSTCFDNLPEEQQKNIGEGVDNVTCKYDVLRYNFNDWKLKTSLDKFPKGKTLGVKLIFKSPILQDSNSYLKNQFNFSIFGEDYNVTLDPDISTCAILNVTGATYTLTADISGSSTSKCMEITANDITLDCQGHTIDGDNDADYGIYLYRASANTTNVTIKNCRLTDWDVYGVYLKYADGNELENLTIYSNQDEGLGLFYSNSNIISNITSNSNADNGLDIYESSNNIFTNITANSNSWSGIDFSRGSSNVFQDMIVQSNLRENFKFMAVEDDQCNNLFVNVIESGGKEIKYYNSSVTLQDEIYSSLILCNADNSNLTNITTIGDTFNVLRTDNSNFTDINRSNTYNGINFYYSSNNILTNLITINIDQYGFYLSFSHDNIVTYSTFTNPGGNGIYLDGADNNTLKHIISTGGDYAGLYLKNSDNNIFQNLTLSNHDGSGVRFYETNNNNTLYDSRIENNGEAGFYLSRHFAIIPYNNTFYNNIINNSGTYGNIRLTGDNLESYFNTTKQVGTNIYDSEIGYIHGNFWTNSSATGFSDTCTDADTDGFCDDVYDLTVGTHIAYDYGAISILLSTDAGPPNVTINTPLNQTYPTNSITFNITVVDDVLVDSCWYSLNSGVTNYTMTNVSSEYTDTNSSMTQGSHTVNFYCNDSSNNLSTKQITFSIKTRYNRTITQPFTTNALTDRLTSIFRNPLQSFTTTPLSERTRKVPRTIIQFFNIFPPANKTYDFTSDNSKAFNNTVANEPPTSLTPAGETEMNYTQINVSDDIYATDTSLTEHPYHKFNMSIEETDVNYVDVLWEGKTSSTGNVSLYVWNYTLNNWSQIDSGSGTTDFNLTKRINDLTNVRQGTGNITFLVQD